MDNVDPAPFPRPSQAEADSLGLVNSLAPTELTAALRAGLVSRWLKNYPLGKTPAQSINNILRGEIEDVNMAFVGIVRTLLTNPEGKRAMRAAGLVGSSMGEEADENIGPAKVIDLNVAVNSDGICYVENHTLAALPPSIQEYLRLATVRGDQPSTGGITLIDPDNPEARAMIDQDMAILSLRLPEVPQLLEERSQRLAAYFVIQHVRQSQRAQNDPEQAAIRRRRREAMVLHEGESPISREDIFQRRMTGDAPNLETGATVPRWMDLWRLEDSPVNADRYEGEAMARAMSL